MLLDFADVVGASVEDFLSSWLLHVELRIEANIPHINYSSETKQVPVSAGVCHQ